MVARVLGEDGATRIVLSELGGAAHLNNYAAPLVAGAMKEGVGAGYAMTFFMEGDASCNHAGAAVFVLARRQVVAACFVPDIASAVRSGLI